MYKDIFGNFRVTFSHSSCERRGARGGRALKKPARSRPPRPKVLRQRKWESLDMRVDGSAPMRRGLVLVRSFFMPPAVPAHPSTRKPHEGGMDATACIARDCLRRTLDNAILMHPCPPLYGESGARRHTPARSLFVRCRPLLGGVRCAPLGGQGGSEAVNAADAGRASIAAPIGAPISPIAAPAGSGTARKPAGAHPPPCPPKNTTFGHIGKPLVLLPRCGGACQHGRILGGRAGGGARGLGGSPKAPPPVPPFPPTLARGFRLFLLSRCLLVWLAPLGRLGAPSARAPLPRLLASARVGLVPSAMCLGAPGVAALFLAPSALAGTLRGLAPGGGVFAPSPCPLPPHPPPPCAVAPRSLCRAPSGRVPLASPSPVSLALHRRPSCRLATLGGSVNKPKSTPTTPLNHLN